MRSEANYPDRDLSKTLEQLSSSANTEGEDVDIFSAIEQSQDLSRTQLQALPWPWPPSTHRCGGVDCPWLQACETSGNGCCDPPSRSHYRIIQSRFLPFPLPLRLCYPHDWEYGRYVPDWSTHTCKPVYNICGSKACPIGTPCDIHDLENVGCCPVERTHGSVCCPPLTDFNPTTNQCDPCAAERQCGNICCPLPDASNNYVCQNATTQSCVAISKTCNPSDKTCPSPQNCTDAGICCERKKWEGCGPICCHFGVQPLRVDIACIDDQVGGYECCRFGDEVCSFTGLCCKQGNCLDHPADGDLRCCDRCCKISGGRCIDDETNTDPRCARVTCT